MEKSFSMWSACQTELSNFFEQEFCSPPIVLCLGSSQNENDCLGAMIGSLLKKHGYQNEVFGCARANITAKNLEISQKFVHSVFPTQKILVIDASTTSHSQKLGNITLKKNYVPFNPKLKNLNLQADWFLFGVCSLHGAFPQMFFAKKLLIEKMANLISKSLVLFSKNCKTI